MSLTKTIFQTKRQFFQWINIVFNKVDEERRRELGPDRTCAEWLLRNGAAVKWVNATDYLTNYNKLPPEEIKYYIKEVDATASSIMHYGFQHFRDCNHIEKVILHKCYYIEDKALEELDYLKKTLIFLQISSCLNITDKGLLSLGKLINLRDLIAFDLPLVKDKTAVIAKLQTSLPNCKLNVI